MVKVGLDRIGEKEFVPLFKDKKIGLVATCSGISQVYNYECAIDVMSKLYQVVALFAPEHGTRGVLGPGEKVKNGKDEITNIPSFSLYDDFVFSKDSEVENGYIPKNSALDGIDVMVFDMQDVGSRYFTYASTLFYVMQACAKRNLPLVLLDRPNPLGGEKVEGKRQEDAFVSFIGLCKMPILHGLTMGELSLYFNDFYKIGCDLKVVPCLGWKRSMFYDETGLPFVKPSPNLPTLDSIYVYNGTCLFAGTNVSEGRGTTTPFTTIGAPYINPVELAETLNKKNISGVKFSPAFFRPNFSDYAGMECRGVNIIVTNKKELNALYMGLEMVRTIQELYPNDFCFHAPKKEGDRCHIDLSVGNTELRTTNKSAKQLFAEWQIDANTFREETKKYWLYN